MDTQKEKRISRVREMKNNLILDAALEIFSEKGFHDTRLEDIATEAGFSKASLYNYYKDKESIFYHLAVREYEQLIDRMEHDPIFSHDASKSFAENMRGFLSITFETFGKHFGFLMQVDELLFIKAIALHTPDPCCENEAPILDRFRKGHDRLDEIANEIITYALKTGEIETKLPLPLLSNTIAGLILGMLKAWRLKGEMDDIEETVEHLIDFLQFGFQAKK